ncbi:glycosyltransferase [Parabacteroides sp. OttesenSCG-928-G07]|nr:glycosyltransferase [Parabacteroides sp. OttesenSCG-928-G21]MDL2277994.1 glycosyltransferase [Parabacteroides sp. OttesenSCG-928-G07]
MDTPKVSIIIPVYNTQDFVRQAVESILQQSLSDIEIIIVNDGSTDNSLAILEDLASKDNRIQLYQQVNQGQAVARNLALQYASGEYIYFMDSDDFLEVDALDVCYQKCQKHQLDFAFFDADILKTEDTPVVKLNYDRKAYTDENKVYGGVEILNLLLQKNAFSVSACLSLIKKSYLDALGLRFYPNIIHEDELFTFTQYILAERVMPIHRTFFHRRLRSNSTMTTSFSWKNMHGYLTTAEEVLKFRKGKSTELQKTTDLYLTKMLNAALWKAHTLPLKQRIKLFNRAVSRYNNYVSFKTLAILLIKKYLPKDKNE